MRLLETGNEKVKKICEVLKRDTLEPAKQQADEIVENAKKEAERMIRHAQDKAANLLKEAEEKIQQQQEVFKASINIAFKQAIGKLKSDINTKIFQQALLSKIRSEMNATQLLGECIKALYQALEKYGFETDAQIVLSKQFSKEQVAALVAQLGIDHLRSHLIANGEFSSGLQVRIEKENLTIDLSDETVQQLILTFASDTLKKLIFHT